MPGKPVRPVKPKTTNANPVIERANANDRFQPRQLIGMPVPPSVVRVPTVASLVAAKYPINQLEHGGSPGINHPSPALAAAARLGGSGVESRGGTIPGDTGPVAPAFTPAVADLSKDPYAPAYDTLLQFVKDSAAARNPQFDATKADFQKQQATSDQGLYNSYMGSRSGADDSARALGVDPLVVSAARDLAMRKNKENSDQSLADNLAWLDKSKMLEGSMLNTELTGFAHDKADKSAAWQAAEQARVQAQNLKDLQALVDAKKAAAKGGGGGGGGKKKKGGGGSKSSSSSGDVTTTATDTATLQYGGADKAIYDELVKTNPAAAAIYLNSHLLNSNDKELSTTQKKVNDLTSASKYTPVPSKQVTSKWLGPSIQNTAGTNKAKQASADLPNWMAVLNAMIGTSGLLGNAKHTSSVKNTAKGKS